MIRVVEFVERLRAHFAGAEVSMAEPRGEVGIVFDATAWHDGCRSLRDEFGFSIAQNYHLNFEFHYFIKCGDQ